MQVSFCFHSLRCSEIVSPSICTKIETWRFHRTEEVSNNFSVSWHITHISMAISANRGRDTDHNSAKLVCDHPLDCAVSSNNSVPRGAKLSAIDMTAETIYERLLLVLGWQLVAKFTSMPSVPIPSPLTLRLFLDFCAIFFWRVAPQFFCHHIRHLAECRVYHKLGNAPILRSGTGSWVLSG